MAWLSCRQIIVLDSRREHWRTVQLEESADVLQLLWAGQWLIGSLRGCDGGVFFWCPSDNTGSRDACLSDGDPLEFTCISASPNGKFVAAGSADGKVKWTYRLVCCSSVPDMLLESKALHAVGSGMEAPKRAIDGKYIQTISDAVP